MTRTTERYAFALGLLIVVGPIVSLSVLAGEWKTAGAAVTILALALLVVLGDRTDST